MRNLAEGNVITLRRFTWPHLVREGEEGYVTFDIEPLDADADLSNLHRVVIIDTETTGLGPLAEIVEVALASFMFDGTTGKVHQVGVPYVALQEPSAPIPPSATDVNGITNEAVKGQHIDWVKVKEMMERADLILAHNAAFDRPIVDRVMYKALGASVARPWGCTMSQIDWKRRHMPSKSLEVLSAFHGFWYDAHRAEADIGAVLLLLQRSETLVDLYRNAALDAFEVHAVNSAFEAKTLLKSRGYQWNGEAKVWWTPVENAKRAQEEVDWLGTEVYTPYRRPNQGKVVRLSAENMFK